METTTIKQIKDGYISDNSLRLYVIEGEGCILYVGRSKCAITRMESHLGLEWIGFFGSDLDLMLTSNPKADEYTVTFYSEVDIVESNPHRDFRLAVRDDLEEPHYNSLMDIYVSDIEEKLIYELSPVFNSMGRKKHRHNSERWYKLHPEPIANEGVIL